MQIFNIVEELEKERIKNKELEEENKKLNNVIYKDYIVKDLENKNYWLKNDIEVYKSRINKAIEYIKKEEKANPDSNRKDVGLILMNYKRVIDILKGDNK